MLAEPELQAGLAWGAPRWGHPEGSVGEHVEHLLAGIDGRDPLRADLRLIAIVHDSFKPAVKHGEPWSPENDHAMLARRFAERFADDERVLATIEHHDAPYWRWKHQATCDGVFDAVPDHELFARFVELDASTEGKDLSFLWWFRRELARYGRLPAHELLPALEPHDGDPVAYVKTFAVDPADQGEVVEALRAMIASHASLMGAEGEVLASAAGLRVQLAWRWRGPVGGRLLRDGDLIRAALEAHPILLRAQALDARIYRS